MANLNLEDILGLATEGEVAPVIVFALKDYFENGAETRALMLENRRKLDKEFGQIYGVEPKAEIEVAVENCILFMRLLDHLRDTPREEHSERVLELFDHFQKITRSQASAYILRIKKMRETVEEEEKEQADHLFAKHKCAKMILALLRLGEALANKIITATYLTKEDPSCA